MDPRLFLGTLQPIGNTLYFEGADQIGVPQSHGWELWKTDGTVSGTVMVKDIQIPDLNPYYPGSCPFLMAATHGTCTSRPPTRPWLGIVAVGRTETGTVMVKDINAVDPFFYGAYPGDPTDLNGTLFFSADDGQTGRELWTVAYVPPAATIGPVAPNPRNTPVSSVTITFNAPVTGFDLSDLSLSLDGNVVSLSGATLSTTDDTTFTLSNLAALTTARGLSAATDRRGIRDCRYRPDRHGR